LNWDVREIKMPYGLHHDNDTADLELLTALTGASKPTCYLQTSAGECTEGEVGVVITQMTLAGTVEPRQLGGMLDCLRHERSSCVAALLREDGRWK